ncbi:MAG: 2-C-methyl-D-erythritol 4-phosphate cytidylyltransferase [Syntrophomonadaceae bacterium]|nr:2-C-methyl-D-erythritol 4-phosphate cytidylyltransferase [Syntrophomonadaceae bacterium]
MAKTTAIIPAAGQGRRMKAEINKQYLPLAGVPLVVHTLQVFQKEPLIDEICLVVAPEEVFWCREKIVKHYGFSKVKTVLAGGKERQDSVYRGLQALPEDCQWVAVHDGARPLLIDHILQRTIREAWKHDAAVAAVPVKDTIKVATANGLVKTTLNRQNLWSVQTPQVFNRHLLQKAYEMAYKDKYYGTDDASLVERLGVSVKLVTGDYENLKITTPEDLELAEVILARRQRTRISG